MIETITVEFDEERPRAPGRPLRYYQERWTVNYLKCRETLSRLLLDAATGTGKSRWMAECAYYEWKALNGRTLIIENRDKLVNQTAQGVAKDTGLTVDIEMADQHASPFAPIVVASVQTLCRDARLTSFADDHFSLVIVDESHHSLARSFLKVLNYFHFGADSLQPEWVMPEPGVPYTPKSTVLGVTATPDITGKRNLGEFYQHVCDRYQLLEAVNDGYLVRPITKNIPLRIDIRGLRPGRTPNGSDFKPGELSERLVPVLEALAEQVALLAGDRKSIAFVPSIECARILAAAVTRKGMKGIFVSGECLDVDEKTDDFVRSGPGTVLVNAALYVEGADFPDISCVICARATKSRGFYVQQVGRGTRVLPGVVDGLETAEERKAAIAASAKPDLLILDPLWISDRLDLMDAYDLFTDKPEVKARMKEMGDVPDLQEAAREAERDFIKALEKEARKHARKAARTVDPLRLSVSLGDVGQYVPETTQDARPPTVGQLEFIRKQGLTVEGIKYLGQASKLIGRLMNRYKAGLATIGQLDFLRTLGYNEDATATLTQREASSLIDRTLAQKKASRTA